MTNGGVVTRILASAGIAVATLYGVFIGGAWIGIHSSTLRVTTLAIALIALALWAVVAVVSPAWRPQSRILPALVLPLVVLAVTTATSRQPRLGLDYVAWSVILVALYLLLVRLMASRYFRPRMHALTIALALIVGLWYLQEVISAWVDWWGLVGQITFPPLRPGFASLTTGNPSAVMTLSILLTLPAVAGIGFSNPRRVAVSVALLVLALVVIALSGSRAGWLGLAIGWTIAGALWLGVEANRALVARTVRSRSIRRALAAAAVLAIGGGLVVLPGILFRAGSGGESLRLTYWETALRMFGEAPVFGTGPGTWVAQRIAYTTTPATDYYIPHAHDLFVQTLAETGLVGALAGLVVIAVVGRLLVRAIRSGDSARVRMGWAATFALTYFAGHQLLDFYANFPAALVAIALPIAWLDAVEEGSGVPAADPVRSGLSRSRQGLLVSVAGLAAVTMAAGSLWWSESWAARHEAAVRAMNAGMAQEALEAARQAASGDAAMTGYQVTLGLAASRTGHPAEAAAAFATGAARDDFPVSWLGLAAARVQLGDRAGALAALERALRLGIAQPAIALGAADLYSRLGEPARADAALTSALLAEPRITGDPNLPGADPASAVDRAIAQTGAPGTAVLMALESGRPEAAAPALARMDAGTRDTYERIIAAWGGDATALDDLEKLARSRPLDLDLIVWVGRIVARLDPAAAERYVSWSNLVNGNAGLVAREIHIATDPSEPGGAGFSSQFYGHYTYRRPTPWDLTPGGVLRLTSP